MTKVQEEFISGKVKYCQEHVKVLKAEEVKKICVEFEFDEDKIDEYLRVYDIEDKYKDVAAYQWQVTVTSEQKVSIRRKKLFETERKRLNEKRLKKLREERA